MIATTTIVTPRHCTGSPGTHGLKGRAGRPPFGDVPGALCWVEPGTDQAYPLSYRAYRRTREAEEKSPPRHRTLGPDVDHYVWRRRLSPETPGVEVHLTVRPDAPPRIRRIVAEVLRAIRRGQPAGDAIRHVARRFGLRHMRARAFITASIGFEVQPLQDAIAPFDPGHWPPATLVM